MAPFFWRNLENFFSFLSGFTKNLPYLLCMFHKELYKILTKKRLTNQKRRHRITNRQGCLQTLGSLCKCPLVLGNAVSLAVFQISR